MVVVFTGHGRAKKGEKRDSEMFVCNGFSDGDIAPRFSSSDNRRNRYSAVWRPRLYGPKCRYRSQLHARLRRFARATLWPDRTTRQSADFMPRKIIRTLHSSENSRKTLRIRRLFCSYAMRRPAGKLSGDFLKDCQQFSVVHSAAQQPVVTDCACTSSRRAHYTWRPPLPRPRASPKRRSIAGDSASAPDPPRAALRARSRSG